MALDPTIPFMANNAKPVSSQDRQLKNLQIDNAEQNMQVGKQQLATGELTNMLTKQKAVIQFLGNANDQNGWDAGLKWAQENGLPADQIPRQFDPAIRDKLLLQSVDAGKRLEMMIDQQKFDETKRHNMATEKNSADKNKGGGGVMVDEDGNLVVSSPGSGFGKAPIGYRFTTKGNLEAIPGSGADQMAEFRTDNKVKAFSDTLDKTNVPLLKNLLQSVNDQITLIDKKAGGDGKGDLPGYGAGGIKPDWLSSREAKDLRGDVQALSNIILKDRSGAAVTNPEFERFRRELGTGGFASDKDLRAGIQRLMKEIASIEQNAVAGVSEDILNRYEENGGVKLNRGGKQQKPPSNVGQGVDAMKAPPAPETREVGKVYATPKGDMLWNGNGWIPATAATGVQ